MEKDLGIWIADDMLLETSYLALLNIVVHPQQTPGLGGDSIFLLFVQCFVKPVKYMATYGTSATTCLEVHVEPSIFCRESRRKRLVTLELMPLCY